jgi:hypothetical protein
VFFLPTIAACLIMSAATPQPLDILQARVEFVGKKPFDEALAPAFPIYVGITPDASFAFKIVRADSHHAEWSVGSVIYLSVIEFAFGGDLKGDENPPVTLTIGKSYDVLLKKFSDPDGLYWWYDFKPIK